MRVTVITTPHDACAYGTFPEHGTNADRPEASGKHDPEISRSDGIIAEPFDVRRYAISDDWVPATQSGHDAESGAIGYIVHLTGVRTGEDGFVGTFATRRAATQWWEDQARAVDLAITPRVMPVIPAPPPDDTATA